MTVTTTQSKRPVEMQGCITLNLTTLQEERSLWRTIKEDSQILAWCPLLSLITMGEVCKCRCLPRWCLNPLTWSLSTMLSPTCQLSNLTCSRWSTDRHLLRWWHHMVHFISSQWWTFSLTHRISRCTTSNLSRWECPLILLTLNQCSSSSTNTTLLMSMTLMFSEDSSKLKSKEDISDECPIHDHFSVHLWDIMLFTCV